MKITVAFLFLASVLLHSCKESLKYVIDGSVADMKSGCIFLIKMTEQGEDTLAVSPIKNGKFQLVGFVPKLTDAVLKVEGHPQRVPVFLENVSYKANLNLHSPLDNCLTGSENHTIYNDYMSYAKLLESKKRDFRQYIREAHEANDSVRISELYRLQREYELKTRKSGREYLIEHADSYVAAFMLSRQMNCLSPEVLLHDYKLLGDNAKASDPGLLIKERLECLDAVSVGRTAPDFTLSTPQGGKLSLYSISGKLKLLQFWASWCVPCIRTNAEAVELYRKYHDKGLEIISVSLNRTKKNWERSILEQKLNWYHLSDLKSWDSETVHKYAVNRIPQFFLLDENNVIVAKGLNGENLKNKIEEMLQ